MRNPISLWSFYNHDAFNKVLNRPTDELYEKIKKSDFLITDSTETHRLAGLFYDGHKMHAPQVTMICMRSEVALAKKYAFELGKKVIADDEFSKVIFRDYAEGKTIRPRHYSAFAELYSKNLPMRMRLEDFDDDYKTMKKSNFGYIGIEFGYAFLPVLCGGNLGEINTSDDEKLKFFEISDDKKFYGFADFSPLFIMGEVNSGLERNEILITWKFNKNCHIEKHLIQENFSEHTIEEIKQSVLGKIKEFYDGQLVIDFPFMNSDELPQLLEKAGDKVDLPVPAIFNYIVPVKKRFQIKKKFGKRGSLLRIKKRFIVSFIKLQKEADDVLDFWKKVKEIPDAKYLDWTEKDTYSFSYKGFIVKGKIEESQTKEAIIEQLKDDIEKVLAISNNSKS